MAHCVRCPYLCTLYQLSLRSHRFTLSWSLCAILSVSSCHCIPSPRPPARHEIIESRSTPSLPDYCFHLSSFVAGTTAADDQLTSSIDSNQHCVPAQCARLSPCFVRCRAGTIDVHLYHIESMSNANWHLISPIIHLSTFLAFISTRANAD